MNRLWLWASILTLSFGVSFAQRSASRLHSAAQDGDKAALQQLLKLAEEGDGSAEMLLAHAYEPDGPFGAVFSSVWEIKGIQKNLAKALDLYHRAAEHGNASAQSTLGLMYAQGLNFPKDLARAFELYRAAAEQGDVSGQLNLAEMYAKGEGVPKDAALAAIWYHKVAVHSNDLARPQAQLKLAQMYAKGEGVSRDAVQSFLWYRKAAFNDGVGSSAWVILGNLYAKGEGVQKSAGEAAFWYHKAAEESLVPNAEAQRALGSMYAEGAGVPKDTLLAYMWWNLAAASGNESAKKKRDDLETRLTPEQIAEAQKLSRDWKPKGFNLKK